MIEILKITLPIVLSFVLGRLTIYLNKKEEKGEKQETDIESMKKGLSALLKVELIEYHDRYMEKGSIPNYALENYHDMYDAYHDLGGNGAGTRMFQEVSSLPVKK